MNGLPARRRGFGLLAVGVALAVAQIPDATLAAPKPQVVDPAGDANFVNRQYLDQYVDLYAAQYVDTDQFGMIGNAALPAGNEGGADVLSVLWQTMRAPKVVAGKKVLAVVGFSVKMTLNGPASVRDRGYTVLFDVPGCGPMTVDYLTTPDVDGLTKHAILECPDGYYLVNTLVFVRGNTITWALSPMPKQIKAGLVFSRMRARTSNNSLPCADIPYRRRHICYYPTFDTTTVTGATYKFGS
jgi:hypothetical protein